jgi:hypothetical protein
VPPPSPTIHPREEGADRVTIRAHGPESEPGAREGGAAARSASGSREEEGAVRIRIEPCGSVSKERWHEGGGNVPPPNPENPGRR